MEPGFQRSTTKLLPVTLSKEASILSAITLILRQLRHSEHVKGSNRVVKNGSVVSILRVSAKQGGDDEKTGGVSTEIR